jgi:Tol biopolymer transport system component
MDHSGNNLQRLTRGTPFLYDGFPAWHPRKQELAFISNRDGRFDIWLLKLKASR